LITLVSDKPGTLELRELSAINTSEGVVIIVGCSQPGIDRILQAATAINPRVHLVWAGSIWLLRTTKISRRQSPRCMTPSKWNTLHLDTAPANRRSVRSKKPMEILISTPDSAPAFR